MRARTTAYLAVLASILAAGALSVSTGLPDEPQKSSRQKTEQEANASYYKKWLDEDVIYIITEDEKKVFKELTTNEEREQFIEQFWTRRDPDPRTPENEFKEEHYRRVAYANERFASGIPGWRTDRGRIYIVFGKPDEIEAHPSGGSYDRQPWEGGGSTSVYPFERWRYRHIDNIGEDVEIEFVDQSMSGEYRIALSPEEKDALLHVPGAGLTWAEELGLSTKADRPYFSPGGQDNQALSFMRAKDQPFERMEQYFNLQRPPQIKFEDLKSIVTTNVTYNQLPYRLRTDFIRLSADKVLVPVTLELRNSILTYKKELDFNRATVNVYGLVTGLTGRIVAEFEDTIFSEFTDANFENGKQTRSIYQKIVSLPPGQRFKLDLAVKDVNSDQTGVTSLGINVPKYDAESLQSSSVILANSITPVPTNVDQLEQFVIGDMKVQPNVTAEYASGQNLIPYLQVYNASIDQTTLEPSVEITYDVKSGEKVLEELRDTTGSTVQFFSGQRLVVVSRIPLKSVAPGQYQLDIKILDRISNRSLVASAPFKVTG